jgi:hypothetical protein
MFKKEDKESFLKQADQAREKRLLEKKKSNAILKIQSCLRGHISRKRLYVQLE